MSHRYYSPLRPLSLGTFPKPQGNEILHIENFEERQNVPEIARQAWGYIMKPLEPDQTAQYKFSDLQMSLYYTIYI